jgi:hypothetical protein
MSSTPTGNGGATEQMVAWLQVVETLRLPGLAEPCRGVSPICRSATVAEPAIGDILRWASQMTIVGAIGSQRTKRLAIATVGLTRAAI